jgi:hypothetical protein
MAKVMEVQARHAHRFDGLRPLPRHDGQRSAFLSIVAALLSFSEHLVPAHGRLMV